MAWLTGSPNMTVNEAQLPDTTARAPDAHGHLTAVISALAGPAATPRDDQLEAVEAIVRPSARVLVVQATGWGKSAVYWGATAALRAVGRAGRGRRSTPSGNAEHETLPVGATLSSNPASDGRPAPRTAE